MLVFGMDETTTAAQREQDRAAIEAVVQRQADAWNHGDAEAFADHYAEDGSFTNILGMQMYGRPGFVEQHARIFSTIYRGSQAAFAVSRIQFLRGGVAVVDVDTAITGIQQLPPGLPAASDGTLRTRLQEVMIRENGAWWVAAFHNVAVVTPPPGR